MEKFKEQTLILELDGLFISQQLLFKKLRQGTSPFLKRDGIVAQKSLLKHLNLKDSFVIQDRATNRGSRRASLTKLMSTQQ